MRFCSVFSLDALLTDIMIGPRDEPYCARRRCRRYVYNAQDIHRLLINDQEITILTSVRQRPSVCNFNHPLTDNHSRISPSDEAPPGDEFCTYILSYAPGGDRP